MELCTAPPRSGDQFALRRKLTELAPGERETVPNHWCFRRTLQVEIPAISSGDIPKAVAKCARENNVAQIFIAGPSRTFVDRLAHAARAIEMYLGNRVEATGDGAGAHVVLWPKRRASEERLVAESAALGVGVYG